MWECDRWVGVSEYGEAVGAGAGVSRGDAGDWVCADCDVRGGAVGVEAEDSAKEEWEVGGVGGV